VRPPSEAVETMKDSEVEPEAEASIQYQSKVLPDLPQSYSHFDQAPQQQFHANQIQVPVKYVPEFINKDTGEPLDEETIHRMNLQHEIQRLTATFEHTLPANVVVASPNLPPQQQSQPSLSDEQFLNFFHTPKPVKPQYSVEEAPEDEPQVLPATQFQVTPQTERPSFIPTTQAKPMHYESSTTVDIKFHQDFLRNYHQLQAETAAKMHRQQVKPVRLQYSVPRRPSNPHHALTLQQRPMPPGMFRPPFVAPPGKKSPPKRQFPAGSQKIPVYASINSIPNRPPTHIRPYKPQRAPQINVQQVMALQKLLTTVEPQDRVTIAPTTPLFPVSFVQSTTENTRLAFNSGFNPSSVKVEGGFKPILNTGIAPVANERMDDMVDEDEVEDNIGVIDLTKTQKTDFIDETSVSNATKQDDDIFKHLKPVMFEPMFVPSPPDTRIYKNPEKNKKKPVNHKYYGNIKSRNNLLEPYNAHKNKYIKMRPRPNLIRRPLYPENVMPPFKIPVRGGSPQFRNHESEESAEDTTDFDIIQMNNDTIDTEDEGAENIFEIMEMESEENTTAPDKMEVVVVNAEDGQVFDNVFQVCLMKMFRMAK